MSDPRRVRVTWRHRGGRKPPGVIYVGRPTRWGNPYPVAVHGTERAVELYRQHLADRPDLVADARAQLAGHDLACYCPPGAPCHADVLLAFANRGGPSGPSWDLRAPTNRGET